MSLPQQIANKIKDIPMDPLALANNPELAFMMSFSQHHITYDSVQCSPRDTYHSPLSDFNFVDFDEKIYSQLYEETKKNYEGKNSTVIKSIRNSFKEFFTRVSSMTYATATKKTQNIKEKSTAPIKLPSSEEQYKIDQMRGNNPSEWPRNISYFHNEINKLPWNAFAGEPESNLEFFMRNVKKAIKSLLIVCEGATQNKKQAMNDLASAIEIYLSIALKTNSQAFILEKMNSLTDLAIQKYLKPEEEAEIVSKLETLTEGILEKIPIVDEQEYHMPKKLWNDGEAFMIMKKIHFQKQNGLGFFSIATDGTYLYVYISAINGGMYKVGTGRNSSVAGKIYFEKQLFLPVGSRLDEINWVFLKGKLYLKSSCRDPFILEVINPQNFTTQGTMEIRCEGLFGHQALVNLNRNSIILTDGSDLFFLGKQLKITQAKQEKQKVNEEPENIPKEPSSSDAKMMKKKKKKRGQSQEPPSQTKQIAQKVVQYVLCKFDVDHKPKESECNEALARELFESFNFFFTMKQCEKALDICDNDISDAAQWLVDEGQKERSIKILYPTNKLIIAQAELTNNFNEKNIKSSNDLVTKDNSMLHIQNINESMWTMDREQITCYSEVGIKIFSKFSEDAHMINGTHLETTFLKTCESKFSRNPEYSIIYDPYNSIFYVFTWPIEGHHFFPTAVLIGSDYKSSIQINLQKRSSVRNEAPKNFTDFPKWLLLTMNLLDNGHCPNFNKSNDWLWFFAQKIIELNKLNEQNNDVDKKKVAQKRSKILSKMNKVNEALGIFASEKKQFQSTQKITKEVYFVPPFAPDGTLDNLQLIREIFGKEFPSQHIMEYIIALQNWLTLSPNIISPKIKQYLIHIRNELIENLNRMPNQARKKITKMFIENFYLFFVKSEDQQKFILTLSDDYLRYFIEKNKSMSSTHRKSITYEISKKELLIQKYDSKSKFEEKFLMNSNLEINRKSQADSIGNLLLDFVIPYQGEPKVEENAQIRDRKNIHTFLEKSVIEGETGLKFFELIFLQAFRLITNNMHLQNSHKTLENLFQRGFRILELASIKSTLSFFKNITQTILLLLQLYFSSLCSLNPSNETIQCILRLVQALNRKQIRGLNQSLSDTDFQGISQTCEKIYETSHPLERGKNQNFPPFKNLDSLLILAEFDKRCQSDHNNDIMHIQLTHEGSPVGNAIHCNDGVFSTQLRMTGKVDTKKPYMILGNSVTVDFSSSGHAKDAKSFGRYGFRFGLRPVFSGKIKFSKNIQSEVEKIFQSKANYERYIGTLKLAVVVASDAIERVTYLEKIKNKNDSIDHILNGKVFKEGYQEEQYLGKKKQVQESVNVIGELLKEENISDSRMLILQSLHQKFVEEENNKKNKDEKLENEKRRGRDSWWNFEGIPAYIRVYLEKIKQFRGDFIDLFKQARKLAPPKLNFANQLKRQGFTEQYKELWLQGEALLFLTVLKHSGLLHLNLKFSIEYIKENLKAFEQARTGIFQSFINKMQIVREWNHLVEEFHRSLGNEEKEEKVEKKEEQKNRPIAIKRKGMNTRTVNFGKNTGRKQIKKEEKSTKIEEVELKAKRKEAQVYIRERLTQNYMIKSICNLKKIDYAPDETYENVTRIIEHIEKEDFKKEIESVYIGPMKRLIESCLFLLKIKSPSTQENLQEGQNLVPDTVTRSFSSDNRHVNATKVNLFREWLENWKKWKDFKKEGKVELKFPVSEIVDFVNSWIPISHFKQQIDLRIKKAEQRLKFYEFKNGLLKITNSTFLSKYMIGSEVVNIHCGYKSDLESVGSVKIELIENQYKNYQRALKEEEARRAKFLPMKFSQFKQLVKQPNNTFLQKIRLTLIHLYIICSQNKNIDLDLTMFVIPFKYLTNSQQQLTFLASLIVQRSFLSENSLEQILRTLRKQIGNNTVCAKRWKDYYFIERVQFLLRKLEKKAKEYLEIRQKRKIAQILFYVLYFIQIPAVQRVCLRIIKFLKIELKNSLQTPYDIQYKAIEINDKDFNCQSFKIQHPKGYNNPELLAVKCSEFFQSDQKSLIKSRLLSQPSNQRIEEETEQNYHIILNLNQEQQMIWLVQVLYYIEEMQKNIVPIKNWEEYQQKKVKKKEQKEHKESNQQNDGVQNNQNDKKRKIVERIVDTFPKNLPIPEEFEKELPSGWFLNYCDVFQEFTTQRVVKNIKSSALPAQPLPGVTQKKNKGNQQLNQNTGKKAWNPVQFLKLYKKFEELTSKPIEQPKEEESEQAKQEFVRAKNFISRMRKHCAEASLIMSNFSQIGYYVYRQNVPESKFKKICDIFLLGVQNSLKQISCDFTLKDYATRLSPAFVAPKKKSELKILCVKSNSYKRFYELIHAPALLLSRLQNQSQFSYTNLNLTEYILQDKVLEPYSDYLGVDDAEEKEVEFGKQFIESEFAKMRMKHDEIILKDYPELKYFLSQGGIESGIDQCTVIPAFDQYLTPQTASFDKILPKLSEGECIDQPEQLLQKSIQLMSTQFTSIAEKKDVKPFMLLAFYLKKICEVDMKFLPQALVKKFGQKLYELAKNFKSNKSTQAYRDHIQILMMRILDSENTNLSYFRLYRLEEDLVDEELKQFIVVNEKGDKDNQKKEIEKQTFKTHQYTKSNYLLPVHPPIPEQNNLLKYWEKNILPKIYDFVKTTLRPLEIQDFFQQMRIPLRIGDQTQAKKIAYVICDNKLPQGAVLPDTNHNWNSLTIQEITVGMDVLVKLPKTRAQCSTPLLAQNNQQYRLAQVVFIDSKNLSVLIKHRIVQYGIFGYTWVPVNTLQAVEKSLAHFSRRSIFKQLEESLKGIIYNYSKVCMTALADQIDLNKNDLMKETIIDTFRNNPISGWQTSKEWPLKKVLKKMLKNGNLQLIQEIQQKFCPYQAYDINLFSEEMLSLNKFDKTLGLLVSFKKNSSIIWYSGIKFYADEFGYKEIGDVYASKTCISEMEPLQFSTANVFCRYYSNKSCLKVAEQSKYEQKQIPATITSVDPIWTSSVFLGSVISEIALQENSYETVLTRLNKTFICWLSGRPPVTLAAHISILISKITRSLIKIKRNKKISLKIADLGVTEEILTKILTWIEELVEQQEKEIIVLYSPIIQNMTQTLSILLSGLQNIPNLQKPLPEYIKESIKLIGMIEEIEQNFAGKPVKVSDMRNPAQFERILVVENIPVYFDKNTLREKFKEILERNNGKILAPEFDIFYNNGSAVILVDSWDINELVEEEVMEKIEQEEEKQPEQQEGGLLMEWQCEICTFFNQVGVDSCEMCQAPPPAQKTQIVYEKVESTNVDKAQQKLRQKEMKRFENIKTQILDVFETLWKEQMDKFEKQREEEEKKKEERRKKRPKKQSEVEVEKVKPEKPQVKLSSGSSALDSQSIENFLKYRLEAFPKNITEKIEGNSYLEKFKHLTKLGYDFWGDHIASQTPTLMNLEYLSQLMEYIQDEICKGSSSVLSYSEDSIRILKSIPLLNKETSEEPINFKAENNMEVKMKYSKLENEKSYNIRYSWRIIKDLNISASKCLSFINMKSQGNNHKVEQINSLGTNIKLLRRLIMGAIKLQLFQKIMQKTSVSLESHQIPKITIERMKIKPEKAKLKAGLISIKEKDQFLFTRAHEQLEKVSSINLRSFKPKGTEPYLSFGVNLKGEDVMGEAGPYRQFFTDISNQLSPNALGFGLFIKTPNNLHKIGESRQKWTINPKANTTYHLSLFKFLGLVMGCCIRTGCHMTLDLCEYCWKVIADEQIKENDIDEFDRQFYEQIRQIIDCPSEQIFDSLEEIVDEPVTWVYQSTDGEEKELIPNGKKERVAYEDRFKYVEMMKRRRIEEIHLQIEQIREGLSEMIPKYFLNHFSGEELKVMICGVPKVDVELLKKHTKYAGNLKEDSPTIKYFWEMMKELSQEQKLKIIRFCWGQERLPLNSEEFERNGIRFMIKPMLNCRNPDQSLPKADTCFFNIELPQYSTKKTMKEKILLAVNLDSTSINGDRVIRADDNPLMGNVDYDDEEEEGEEREVW